MPVQTVIKTRRDTAANWLASTAVLAVGEAGLETDTRLVKYGNGADVWADLEYASTAVVKEIVKNSTGSTIPKGSAVYVSGSNGDNALISLADADTEATSSKTLGLTTSSITDGSLGAIITNGLLKGVDTSTATAGDSVWLSSTAGGIVFAIPPAKPAHNVYIGVVVRVHATNGAILVKVQNGYELNELHDLNIVDPQPGDALVYDNVSGMWVNGASSGGLTVSETAPADPNIGDMWLNSSNAKTFVYYDSYWIEDSNPLSGANGTDGADGTNGTDGVDGGFDSTQIVESKSANYTLQATDKGKLITNSAAVTITVQGLAVGEQVDFLQTNAAQFTFVAGSGMTLGSKSGNLKTSAQYSPASIKCVATDTYVLVGDLAA